MSNSRHKYKKNTFTVAFAGSVGSGKTCTAKNVVNFFNDKTNLVTISKKWSKLIKFGMKAFISLEAPKSSILKRYYSAFKQHPIIITPWVGAILCIVFTMFCLIFGSCYASLVFLLVVIIVSWFKMKFVKTLTPMDVSFDTQMYFLSKRKKDCRKSLHHDGLIVNDRSWLEDELFPKMQFQMGHLSALQFGIYNDFFQEYSYEMPYPDIWIYLKSSSKRTFTNVKQRLVERKNKGLSTLGEEMITQEYLDALVREYDKWGVKMKKKFGDRFIIIDCETSHNNVEFYLDILNKHL